MLHNRNEMVSALTDDGHVLSVGFNKAYTGALDKSMVSVFASKSLARVGVESVELASNGLSAEIVFFDNTNEKAKDEIERLVNYTMKIGTLSFEFARPMYADEDDNARITAVDADEREITLGTDGLGSPKLTVPESLKVDFQQILGQTVRIWWDANDVVIDMELQSEVIYDAFQFTEDDEIETVDEEVAYDIAEKNVEFYVDDVKKTVAKSSTIYDYAKIVLNDDGDVQRIYAYDFDSTPINVEEVDDDFIIDFDGSELDLEDYIVVKNGMQIAISDIEKGDLVFFSRNANDKDGYAVVYNNTISGEIEAVYTESFDLDGKNYSYSGKYLNEDNDKKTLDFDGAEKLQAGGDVTVYFDFQGDVILVTGTEGAVESEYATTYTTDAIEAYKDSKGNVRMSLEVVDKDGDEKSYDFAIDSLDEIEVQASGLELEYEVDEDTPTTDTDTDGDATEFEIDEFGIVDGALIGTGVGQTSIINTFTIRAEKASDADNTGRANIFTVPATGPLMVGVATDDDGDVTGLKFYSTDKTAATLEYDENYAEGKRLQDDTIVIGSDVALTVIPDADEVTFYTWGELEEAGTDLANAVVHYDEDDNVTHLVVAGLEAGDTSKEVVLLNRVDTIDDDGNKEITRVKAWVDGVEKIFDVDNVDFVSGIAKGKIVTLVINDKTGEVDKIEAVAQLRNNLEVLEVDTSGDRIRVGANDWVTLANDGDVYEITGDYEDISLSQIKVHDIVDIALVSSGSKFADVIVVVTDAPEDEDLDPISDASMTVPNAVQTNAPIAVVLPTENTDVYLVKVTDAGGSSYNYAIMGESGSVTAASIDTNLSPAVGEVLTVELYKNGVKLQSGTAVFGDIVAPATPTEDGTADKEGTPQAADFNIVVNAETGSAVTAKIGTTNVLKTGTSVTAAAGKATLGIDITKLALGANAITIAVTDAATNASSPLTVNVTRLNTVATLTSTLGTVDGVAGTIVDIPNATTLAAFKAGITPAAGATIEVYEADGTTVATDLQSTYKVTVTAEDGVTTKTYTLTVL